MTAPSPGDLLCLDIDCRIADLWADACEVEEWGLVQVGAFLRAAYGRGYTHALAEAERGELCKTHGYKTPQPGDLRRVA